MAKKNQENSTVNKKIWLENIFSNTIVLLLILGIGGIIIRLVFFPHAIPLGMDASTYFWYATDMSILGNFPSDEQLHLEHSQLTNNGWPSFLSVIFSFYNSNNIFDYMVIQRYTTMIISVLTIIPVYKLCSKFFNKYYSIIGAALFVFEPRIILNSLSGITEPAFILIGTSSIALFFSNNKKAIYCAFGLASIFALIRYEGLVLLIPLTIMFFVRFRREKTVFFKYAIVIGIILLILVPMAYIRIENTGNDGLISHIVKGPVYYQKVSEIENQETNAFQNFAYVGSLNLIKFLGYVTVPVFVLFAPIGLLLFFRNRDYKKNTIIFVSLLFLLPAFYAYSRDILELRYLYILYPIFCLLSLYTIDKLLGKTSKKIIVSIVIIFGVIISSIIFLDYKTENYEHEREAFLIAQHIDLFTETINGYHPEDQYYDDFRPSNLGTFPVLSNSIEPRIKLLYTTEFNSLKDFLEYGNKHGLSHLVIDENQSRPDFLKDVFYNEEKYPFLKIEFDSKEKGFQYHVKAFKIDFDIYKKFYIEQAN